MMNNLEAKSMPYHTSSHNHSLSCVMFYRSLFVLYLLVIVLSVLQFTASDYPFLGTGTS